MLVNELDRPTVFYLVSKKLETKFQAINMAASGCDGDGTSNANLERQNSVPLSSNGAYTVGKRSIKRGSHSEETEPIATMKEARHTVSPARHLTPNKASSGKNRSPDIREYFTVTGHTPTSVGEIEIFSSTPTKPPKKRKNIPPINWNKLDFTSILTKAPTTPTAEKFKSSSSGTCMKPSVCTSLTYRPYGSICPDLKNIESVRKRNREGRKVFPKSRCQYNTLTNYFDPDPRLKVNAVEINMQAGQLSASSLGVVDGCETWDAPNVPKLKLCAGPNQSTSFMPVNDNTKQRTPLSNLANDRSSTGPLPSKIPHKKLENTWNVIPGYECLLDAIDYLKKSHPPNCKSVTRFEKPNFEIRSTNKDKSSQNSDITTSSVKNDSNTMHPKVIVFEEERGNCARGRLPSTLSKEFVSPIMTLKDLAIDQTVPLPTVRFDVEDSERKRVSTSLMKKCPIIDLTSSPVCHSRPTQPSDIDTVSTSMRQNSSDENVAVTAHSLIVQHKKEIYLPARPTAHKQPVVAYVDLTRSIDSPKSIKPPNPKDSFKVQDPLLKILKQNKKVADPTAFTPRRKVQSSRKKVCFCQKTCQQSMASVFPSFNEVVHSTHSRCQQDLDQTVGVRRIEKSKLPPTLQPDNVVDKARSPTPPQLLDILIEKNAVPLVKCPMIEDHIAVGLQRECQTSVEQVRKKMKGLPYLKETSMPTAVLKDINLLHMTWNLSGKATVNVSPATPSVVSMGSGSPTKLQDTQELAWVTPDKATLNVPCAATPSVVSKDSGFPTNPEDFKEPMHKSLNKATTSVPCATPLVVITKGSASCTKLQDTHDLPRSISSDDNCSLDGVSLDEKLSSRLQATLSLRRSSSASGCSLNSSNTTNQVSMSTSQVISYMNEVMENCQNNPAKRLGLMTPICLRRVTPCDHEKHFKLSKFLTNCLCGNIAAELYAEFLDSCTTVCSRNRYPDVKTLQWIVQFTMNIKDAELALRAITTLHEMIAGWPPCSPQGHTYYIPFLLEPYEYTNVKTSLFDTLVASVEAMFLQDESKESDNEDSDSVSVEDAAPTAVEKFATYDHLCSTVAAEALKSRTTYATLSPGEQRQRLEAVLDAVVHLLEQDLLFYLSDRTHDKLRALTSPLKQPLVVKVVWFGHSNRTIGTMTAKCRRIVKLYLASSGQARRRMVRLISLMAEVVSLSELTKKSCSPTYIGPKCHEFAREMLNMIPDSADVTDDVASELKPSWLALTITHLRLCRLMETDRPISLEIVIACLDLLLKPMPDPHDCPVNKKPSKVNRRYPNGETRLHIVCRNKKLDELRSLLSDPDIDVNIKDNAGWTPLHEAVSRGNLTNVDILLNYKPGSGARHVDVRSRGPNGETVLMEAALCGWDNICERLFKHAGFCLLGDTDDKGLTAMEYAKNPEIKRILKAAKDNYPYRTTQSSPSLSSRVLVHHLPEMTKLVPAYVRHYLNTYQLHEVMKLGKANAPIHTELKEGIDYSEYFFGLKNFAKIKKMTKMCERNTDLNPSVRRVFDILHPMIAI